MLDFIVGFIFIVIVYKVCKSIYDERRIVNIFRRKKNDENH